MKEKVLVFLCLLMAMVSYPISAFSSNAMELSLNRETEMNDTYEDADTVSVNEQVYGSLRTSDDNDWYKATVTEDGYLSLEFSHEYVESDNNWWEAYLYDADRKELAHYRYKGKEKIDSLFHTVLVDDKIEINHN